VDDNKAMAKDSDSSQGPYTAYMLVAFVSAFASAAIVLILFVFARIQATNEGVWALAAVVFAPAIMGIGVSCFVYRTSVSPYHVRMDHAAARPSIGRPFTEQPVRGEEGIRQVPR
jgi:hypothetical protein